MDYISIRDFRSHIAEALKAADAGVVVTITKKEGNRVTVYNLLKAKEAEFEVRDGMTAYKKIEKPRPEPTPGQFTSPGFTPQIAKMSAAEQRALGKKRAEESRLSGMSDGEVAYTPFE